MATKQEMGSTIEIEIDEATWLKIQDQASAEKGGLTWGPYRKVTPANQQPVAIFELQPPHALPLHDALKKLDVPHRHYDWSVPKPQWNDWPPASL